MSVAVSETLPARGHLYELTVEAVAPVSADGSALALTLRVPASSRAVFAFRPGQHLTVEQEVDGVPLRRSYSLCSTPAELADAGRLRIGVRLLPGGAFSGWVHTRLRAGAPLRVLAPAGRFTTDLDPRRRRHYVAVAAGSGITPVLSLLATALATEPGSRFTLVYGNRRVASTMFLEELADLKDRWPDRLHVAHVLSRERHDTGLPGGRLDAAGLERVLARLVRPSDVDEWFLCGPQGMVAAARGVLGRHGVPTAAVRSELFHVDGAAGAEPATGAAVVSATGAGRAAPAAGPQRSEDAPAGGCELVVHLDGRSSTGHVPPGERVLDAAMRSRPELPYSCLGGVCATCRAKVVRGAVRMAVNWALDEAEVAAGYILTCQSTPVTDHLTVDFDV